MVLTREALVQNGALQSFSFNPAELEAKIKSDLHLQAYDKSNPNTWPLITLTILNRYLGGEYTGRQDLPRHVAYDAIIMQRFMAKHASKELSRSSDTLHSRYPCNFTQLDILNKQIGMTTIEEEVFKHDKRLVQRAEVELNGEINTPIPSRARQPTSTPRPQASKQPAPCQNVSCVEGRQQIARLQVLLSNKNAEHKMEIQGLKAQLAKWKRSFEVAEAESEEARNRAMAAEDGRQAVARERDILQTQCAELRAEIGRLKGSSVHKRARVEDYESDDETKAGMSTETRVWKACTG